MMNGSNFAVVELGVIRNPLGVASMILGDDGYKTWLHKVWLTCPSNPCEAAVACCKEPSSGETRASIHKET